MLLRRVTEHIKDQNWFAVGLDFMIVVLGVFIGLQVSNWNDARQMRIDEHSLLLRLYSETIELGETRREEVKELKERHAVLYRLRPVLFSKEPSRSLTTDECRKIALSNILPKPSDDLPALERIVVTGGIDVLRSRPLQNQLREFLQYRERARAWHQEASQDLFRLAHLYPDLLSFDFIPVEGADTTPKYLVSGSGYLVVVKCDLAALKSSPALLNDYVDNLARLSATINYNYEGIAQRLEALQASLATELGLAQ